ncbi:Flp family type IVb pilin [Paraburkholderia sp. JPY419]|uniref:Flp family type IVb pilin n=1 Tax=Paraburkholderia sp. JPY419 TaxID=667660 RepID=UPI003D20B648
MKKIIATAVRFVRDEDGVTAIEYALLGSLIALAIIGAVKGLATNLNTVFDSIASSI